MNLAHARARNTRRGSSEVGHGAASSVHEIRLTVGSPAWLRSQMNHANAIPELPLRPSQPCAVHHRESLAEDVEAREPAALEDRSAALDLEESEPKQHDHKRRKI